MTVRRTHGVLWTLLAGSVLLSVGCTNLNGLGALTNPSQLKENESSLIGNNSASLIGNNSASLIGNNSAALANKGLSALGSAMTDVEGARMSKLIGNNSASLIGNNAASLIGNNSASLIGNNSAAFRTQLFAADPVITWVDTGNWPTGALAKTTYSGTLTGSISTTVAERYAYSHQIRDFVTLGGQQVITSYLRTETVDKSAARPLGQYQFDANLATSGADNGAYVYTQTYTKQGGLPLVLKTVHRYNGNVVGASIADEVLSGSTSQGASVSITTSSRVNTNQTVAHVVQPGNGSLVVPPPIDIPANTISLTQSGTVEGLDGNSFHLDVNFTGSFQGTDPTSTGTIDLTMLGNSTDSIKVHFDVTQPAGQHATYAGSLLDKDNKQIATLAQVGDVFRATFTGGATQDIPVSTIDKVLDLANRKPDKWGW